MIGIEPKNSLLDWILNFLKNKDLIYNKIIKIEENSLGYDAVITYKDKVQNILIIPSLDEISPLMSSFKGDNNLIVTLNSKESLDFLIIHWKEFINFKNIVLYFVNPFSALEKKWIIFPHTHNKICDEKTLKQGLISIFQTVEEISYETFKSNI